MNQQRTLERITNDIAYFFDQVAFFYLAQFLGYL